MWQKQVRVNFQDPFGRTASDEDDFPYLDGISPIRKIASAFVLDPAIYSSDNTGKICTLALKDIPSKPTIKAASDKQCRDHLQIIGVFKNGDILARTTKETKIPHIRVPEDILLPPLQRIYEDKRSKKEKLLHPLHPALPKFAIDVINGVYGAYEDSDFFPIYAKDLFYHPGTEWEFDKYNIGDIKIPTFKKYIVFQQNEEKITPETIEEEEATQEDLTEGIERLKNVSKFTIAHGLFGELLQFFMFMTITVGGLMVCSALFRAYGIIVSCVIIGAFAISTICAIAGIRINRADVSDAIHDLEQRLGKSLETTTEKGLDIPLTSKIIEMASTFEDKQRNKAEVHTPFWYNDNKFYKIRNLYDKEKSKLDAKYASVIVEND